MKVTGTELYDKVKLEGTSRSKSDNKSIHGNKYTALQRWACEVIHENGQ